jgi:hypothetical protein
MPPHRKLGVNDKDTAAASFAAYDARRHWVAGDERDLRRNAHPGITANQQDHGFEHLHLHLDVIGSMFSAPLEPPNFDRFGARQATAYTDMVGQKLALAKNYILQEQALGLDPYRRNSYKEKTALMLAAPPIRIAIQAQNLIRLLLEGAEEIKKLMEGGPDSEVEIEDDAPMQDYWLLWTKLRDVLAWQMPGWSENEKVARAGKVMARVLEDLVGLDE